MIPSTKSLKPSMTLEKQKVEVWSFLSFLGPRYRAEFVNSMTFIYLMQQIIMKTIINALGCMPGSSALPSQKNNSFASLLPNFDGSMMINRENGLKLQGHLVVYIDLNLSLL